MQKLTSLKQVEVLLDGGEPFLLKFSAEWCQPCHAFAPVVARAMKKHPEIQAFEVDFDELPAVAKKYKIKSIPTLLLFCKGELLDSFIGADAEVAVLDWIKETLEEAKK